MYVLDKRNTLWLRDTVRQTSLRKSEAGRPLTSLGMSAWPYRVTTKYTYHIYHSRYSILSYILWESASIFHCHINVCCTDFFRRHMYILLSFLSTKVRQVVKSSPCGRQRHIHTLSYYLKYHKFSNTRRIKSTKLKCVSSRLAVISVQYIETRCSVDNEDVIGAAPTGDALSTSEWSTILLPTKVRLILKIWGSISISLTKYPCTPLFYTRSLNSFYMVKTLAVGCFLHRQGTSSCSIANHQTSNINHTFVGNKLVGRSDEWVFKFNGLCGDSGQWGPYKPCNHSLYIGIIIFPNIDNTQSTGHN